MSFDGNPYVVKGQLFVEIMSENSKTFAKINAKSSVTQQQIINLDSAEVITKFGHTK